MWVTTSPVQGNFFQHSASFLGCSAPWGWQDVLKSIFIFNTSKISSFNCSSWLQVPCGIRPHCSVRRRMVHRIGTRIGTGVRTAEMQTQVPEAWLSPLVSLTYILHGDLVYKCPLVWSAAFVMGWQYSLRLLHSILLPELTTCLRNLKQSSGNPWGVRVFRKRPLAFTENWGVNGVFYWAFASLNIQIHKSVWKIFLFFLCISSTSVTCYYSENKSVCIHEAFRYWK